MAAFLDGGSKDFKALAELQEGVSPILAHIYRENGVYLEAVQKKICSMVNLPDPQKNCR
jgi:hypothetical protein